jgi:hypothetical protein
MCSLREGVKISWLDENLRASQEGHCIMELVPFHLRNCCYYLTARALET